MAKKIGLDLGKREIKPAQVIEETHAAPAPASPENIKPKADKNTKPPISRRKRAKKDWVVKSVRMEKVEYDQVEAYMKENDISFNALVLDMLAKEGVINE